MKILRKIYLYGLNEAASKRDSEEPVGKLLFSIPNTKQRSSRYRYNNDYLQIDTITELFANIHNIIQNDIKEAFCKIYIMLNNLKKEIRKQIS